MHNVLEYIQHHLKKMLALGCVLTLELVALIVFSHDQSAQRIIVIIMASTYALWGITDHALQKNLNLLIALEYIGIAALAAFGVLFVMGWSG